MSTTPQSQVAVVASMNNAYADFQQKFKEDTISRFMGFLPPDIIQAQQDTIIDEFINGPRRFRYFSKTEYMTAEDPRNPTGVSGQVFVGEELRTKPVDDKGNTYDVNQDPNTLPGMIMQTLRRYADAELAKFLESATTNTNGGFDDAYWKGHTPFTQPLLRLGVGGASEIMSKLASEWVEKNGATILETMIGNALNQLFSSALMAASNRARGNGY